jgi:hypothetical protein
MQVVNRVALVVRPKRRYVEWVNGLEADRAVTLEEARGRPTVYLVDAEDEPIDETALIDAYAQELFEQELGQWELDDQHWPPNRTPHVFRDWFDVELVDLVLDADADVPLVDDGVPDAVCQCAWCKHQLDEDEEPLSISLRLRDRAPVLDHEGGTIEWPLRAADRSVIGIVSHTGSAAALEGADIVFVVCSTGCAGSLKQALGREGLEVLE